MQVLLLSRGDAASKDLLRRALAARYGFGAPALDTLKLTLKGRARLKVARLMTWVPLEATAYFKFPLCARWEYSLRPAGLPINVGVHAFDGTHYRRKQGDRVEMANAAGLNDAMRDQVWASALMLLSPMVEPEVEIRREDEHALIATRMDTGTCVRLILNADYTLDHIEFPTLDPETLETRLYRLSFNAHQIGVNGFALPSMISMAWGDEPQYDLAPIGAQLNPTLTDSLFQLGA